MIPTGIKRKFILPTSLGSDESSSCSQCSYTYRPMMVNVRNAPYTSTRTVYLTASDYIILTIGSAGSTLVRVRPSLLRLIRLRKRAPAKEYNDGKKRESCCRDFPSECLGCDFYRSESPRTLTRLALSYGVYQPTPKIVEKCLKHKYKSVTM